MPDDRCKTTETIAAEQRDPSRCEAIAADPDRFSAATVDGGSAAGTTAPWFDAGDASAIDLARGQTVGRYVVLDRLGAGGMAVVYTAWDPELDRKVALKLLKPADAGEEDADAQTGRMRLVREAQAMARLAHPNVVAVHDVGSFGESVFVAIELVEGGDLEGLLGRERPGWRRVVALFAEAGRGLAAAHASGLVHRDFKPANVLVGTDGRVRVADFGLARESAGAVISGARVEIEMEKQIPRLSGSGSALSADVTRHGAILGTPAYMAPEQFLGGEADARTDQFSFCAALYEALYGELPFRGETIGELFAAISAGRIQPPPAGSKAPKWLRGVLARGLAPNPAARYPSMDALLAELTRDRGARWRRAAVACAVALVVGGAAFAWARAERAEAAACERFGRDLAGVWDAGAKAKTRAAFLATGKPFARDSFERISSFLDGYSDAWLAARRSSCEEARAGGGGAEVSARRGGCLTTRLAQLDALTGLFERADEQTVEKAVEAAHGLGSVEDCADSKLLASGASLPAEPKARAAVTKLREKLARGWALADLYKTQDSIALGEEAVGEARRIAFRPALGEALALLGTAEMRGGAFADADRDLDEALYTAMAAGDDRTAADAAIRLVEIEGFHLADLARSDLRVREAAAALDRAGEGATGSYRLERARGWLERGRGAYDEAAKRFERALALIATSEGRNTPEAARVACDLGEIYQGIGQHRRALPFIEQAVSIWTRSVGMGHPQTVISTSLLAWNLGMLGRFDEAFPRFDAAAAAIARALGPDHPELADSFSDRSQIATAAGRYDEAVTAVDEAIAITEKKYGTKSIQLVQLGNEKGDALWRKGDFGTAIPLLEENLVLAERAGGKEHLDVAVTCFYLGRAYVAAGRTEDAVRAQRRTVEIAKVALGPDHPMSGYAYEGLGEALLADGDAAGAILELEKAVAIFDEGGIDEMELARSRFNLARALTVSKKAPERVTALLTHAREGFTALKDRGRIDLEIAEKWAAQQGL